MSDEIDDAQQREQEDTDRAVTAARAGVKDIPEGDPGECDFCGYVKQRLVGGACATCRDEFKLD